MMGVLSIFDEKTLKAGYELLMENIEMEIPEGLIRCFGRSDNNFNQGSAFTTVGFQVSKLKKKGTLALELIKICKTQLEEFEILMMMT
ncbi:hypothetical protein Tco_1545870 [Tanacetum coccineum]